MKKNALSLAVATSVAALSVSTVQADMYLNHEGTGEVLLFPFYDAENGNATNMHIVNTTSEAKAVKVRFLEYKSSYEVLDFNLYLSPKDHFAFGVIMDPNGTGGAIITSDNSCTVPALGSPNNGFDGTTTENADGSVTRIQPFVNFEFVKGKFVDQDVERTVRGHVEVIEMGVVGNASKSNPALPTELARQYKSFMTHGADGVPANCDGLAAAWAGGGWGGTASSDPQDQVTRPTGGLYGLAYHINVEDAAAWGFEPAAIDDWSGAADKLHALPGSVKPSLGSTSKTSSIVVASGTSAALTWLDADDAVSSLLMTKSISNDVMLNAAIGAQTDWVTTFPHKRPYVTNGFVGRVPAKAPFSDPYHGRILNAAETAYEEQLACEPMSPSSTDREEARTIGGNDFSPKPPGALGVEICDEQHTVAWGTGTDSALNVERDLYNLGFAYTDGWATWTFDGDATATPAPIENSLCDAATAPTCLEGLPAIGFAAYKYSNGSSGSVMMNYGHAADHKYSVTTSATAFN